LLVLLVVLLGIGVLLAVGVPMAVARSKRAIELRCARAVHGQCTVGSLELARSGARAHTLTATGINGGVSLTVATVDAAFSWWDALVGKQPLSVALRIEGVMVRDTAALADVVREVQSWRDEPSTTDSQAAGRSRIKLNKLSVVDVSMQADVAPFTTAALSGGSIEWQPDNGMQIRWSNVGVTLGPISTLRTGPCSVELPADGVAGRVECEQFRSTINTQDIQERVQSVMGLIDLLRSLGNGRSSSNSTRSPAADLLADADSGDTQATDGRATSGAAPRELRFGSVFSLLIPRSWQIVTRGGSVALQRGTQQIANLTPASATISVAHGHLHEVSARLGDPAAGPALDVTVRTAVLALGSRSIVPWSINAQGEALPLREVARWVPSVPWHDVDNGRVRLSAQITPTQDGVIQATGECSIENFALSHPKLSHDPVTGLTVSLEGTVLLDRQRHRAQSTGLTVTVNHVQGFVSGWAERGAEHVALDVNLRMDRTSCDGIRTALPASLTGPVAELSLGGELAAAVHIAVDTRQLDATAFDVQLDDRCYVSRNDSFARGARRFAGPFVQRVQEPTGVRAFVTGPGTAVWAPLSMISPYVINAVLSREDGRFYRHAGVDPLEIRHAIVRNLSAGRFVYGASTISMQLAKNVFLAREKTLVRKLQEFALTWYLERTLGKDSILELYLNVVEFGPGVYGIAPASRFYFDREPSELTPLQAIFLATLLPSPVQRSAPFFRGSAGPSTLAMLRGHARIMNFRGLLTAEELASANTETLTFRPRRAPVGGALTLEVLPTLDETAAVTEALARVVPVRPPTAALTEPAAQVASADSPDETSDSPDESEHIEASSTAPTAMDDSRAHARGYQRATIRIGAMP
jgi:hypothetical protein